MDKEIDCTKKLMLIDQFLGSSLEDSEDKQKFTKCLVKWNTNNFSKNKSKKNSKGLQYGKLLKLFNKITSKLGTRSELYKDIKELQKQKNILAKLLEAYIYMRMANQSRAQKIFIEIMSKDFFEHLLNSDISNLDLNIQITKTIYLLNLFEEDFKNEKVVTALIFYLYQNTTGKFKEELDESFEIPQGLKDIRNGYRSNRFGITLPFVWGPSIYELSSRKEYITYLYKTDVYEELRSGNDSLLLFYRKVDNIRKKEQQTLIKRFEEISKKESLFHRYIFLEVITNENFYKFLTAHSKIHFGLITNLKRKYYQRLLRETNLKEYALLNLIKLGDVNDDYLIELFKE